MDVGLVSIEFQGVADPLLAQIERVKASLASLTTQVETGAATVATRTEGASTAAVAAGTSRRATLRKTEVTEDTKLAEEQARVRDRTEANIRSSRAATDRVIQSSNAAQMASEKNLTREVETNVSLRERAYRREAEAKRVSALPIGGAGFGAMMPMPGTAGYYDAKVAEAEARRVGMMEAKKRAGLIEEEAGGMSRYEQMIAVRGAQRMMSGGGLGAMTPFALFTGHPAVAAGLAGGAGITAWTYEVGKAGAEYQKVLANMGAQTQATGVQLDAVGKKAREFAMAFGTDAKDNIDAYRILVNGFGLEVLKSRGALDGMVETTNRFALAANIPVKDAAEVLRTTFNNMGYSIDGPGGATEALKHFNENADIMASGMIRGQLELGQIGPAMVKAGAVASRFGVNLRDAVSALEVLGKVGAPGSDTGTALRNILLYTNELTQSKKGLSALAGIGLKPEQVDIQRLGMGPVFETIKKAFDAASEQAQNSLMTALGKVRWQGFADVFLKNLPKFEEFRKEIGKGGEVAEMSARQMETTSNKWDRLKAKFEDVLLGSFESDKFNSVLTDIGHLADTLVADEPQLMRATSMILTVLDAIATWAPPVGSFAYHAIGALATAPVKAIGEVATYPAQALHNLIHPAAKKLPELKTGFLHAGDPGAPSEYAASSVTAELAADKVKNARLDAEEREARRASAKASSKSHATPVDINYSTGKGGGGHHKNPAEVKAEEDAYREHTKALNAIRAQIDDLTDAEVKQKEEQAQLAFDEKMLAIKKKFGDHSVEQADATAREELRIAKEKSDDIAKTEEDADAVIIKSAEERMKVQTKIFEREAKARKETAETIEEVHNEIEDRTNRSIKDQTARELAEENTAYAREKERIEKLTHGDDLTYKQRQAYYDDLESLAKEHTGRIAQIEKDANARTAESFGLISSALDRLSSGFNSNASAAQNWGQVLGAVLAAIIGRIPNGGFDSPSVVSPSSPLIANSGLRELQRYKPPSIPDLPRPIWASPYQNSDMSLPEDRTSIHWPLFAEGGYVGFPGYYGGGVVDPWAIGGSYGVPGFGNTGLPASLSSITGGATGGMSADTKKALMNLVMGGTNSVFSYLGKNPLDLTNPENAKYRWSSHHAAAVQPKHNALLGTLHTILPLAAMLIPGAGPMISAALPSLLDMAGINDAGSSSLRGGGMDTNKAMGMALGMGSSILGLSIGGFTGPGTKYEPAGIVHRGEYVFDADTTQKIGVQNLMAVHKRVRGYADGGLVGDSPAMPGSGNNGVHERLDRLISVMQKPQRSFVTTGDIYAGGVVGDSGMNLISL